jgi:uncharacterized lipoprotein YddW (UPF0748 family)
MKVLEGAVSFQRSAVSHGRRCCARRRQVAAVCPVGRIRRIGLIGRRLCCPARGPLVLLGAVLVGGWGGTVAHAAERFEVAAWVDHFDFAGVAKDGAQLFDTETAEGVAKILDHVQEVGATTVLWRNCGGANMRYQSRVESHHNDSVLDKRRIPDSRPIHGWVRYGDAEPDLLRTALDLCRRRGLRPGVHWPFEETHWQGWTLGGWNLEHPQFWGRSVDGQPWAGRGSLAFDEVLAHKLALVDELIERGTEVLFIDFFRNGGWSPAYEYVEPVVAEYRRQHGVEPPLDPTDPVWCRHVATYVTRFMRAVRQRFDASGRKIELWAGIPDIAPVGDQNLRSVAADWQQWVADGLLDALVINYVRWDAKDPWNSTQALCGEVKRVVDGRCRVLCPVRAYDYGGYGMPSYQQATDLSQDQLATKLMRLAWEDGAAGVSLECVDYNNYRPETRQAMKALAEGECRWAKTD